MIASITGWMALFRRADPHSSGSLKGCGASRSERTITTCLLNTNPTQPEDHRPRPGHGDLAESPPVWRTGAGGGVSTRAVLGQY